MTRYTRIALLLGVLILTLPLLAACGGDNDEAADSGPSPTVAAAESTSPVDEPTSTADADAEGVATPTVAAAGETPSGEPVAQATTAPEDPTATAASESPADPTATTATTAPVAPQPSGSNFAYGWNVAMRGDENGRSHNMNTNISVQQTGFEWVRFQMEWSQFQRGPESWDPLPMDRVIQDIYSSGLKILVVVAKAPDWALDPTGQQFLADYATFETFMTFVADRYKGRVQAWEIWNEQNLAHEVNGTVRVSDYMNLLRAGHNGVRAGDPNALIVFGGLTPNGVNDPSIAIDDVQYLDEVYAYNDGEVRQYFDIMGAHVSATQTGPDNTWPDNPGAEGWSDHPSFFFRRAEELRQVMVNHGDEDKSMWLTEFGWTTENQAPGYEYGQFNSEEDVAQYLTRSFEIMLDEWGWVSGAFVWNLNWTTLTPPDDEKYPWSAVREDWTPRPAYEAMKNLPKR
jgi:polysaccharide biosynthesis protein PslG